MMLTAGQSSGRFWNAWVIQTHTGTLMNTKTTEKCAAKNSMNWSSISNATREWRDTCKSTVLHVYLVHMLQFCR